MFSARGFGFGLAVALLGLLGACDADKPETIHYPPLAATAAQAAAQPDLPAPPQPAFDPQGADAVPGNDGTLAAMVESAIAAEPELNGLGIDVSAVEGTVYLRGEARTRESRRLATQVASSVDGVKRVHNELFVMAGASSTPRRIGSNLAVLR